MYEDSQFKQLLDLTHSVLSVSYSGRLGDRYTGLGVQVLAPKKHFSSFLFSVVLR